MPTVYVPLDRIQENPFNTRSHYDPEAVAELADSIERDGQLQTPVARVVADHKFKPGEVLPIREHCLVAYAGPGEMVSTRDLLAEQDLLESAFEHTPSLRVQLAYGHTRARAWRAIWDRRGEDLVAGADGVHGCPPGCMPVELRPLTDDAMERLAWEENERRRDLDPVDRAAAIAARIARHGWTHEEAGERLGLDRSTVSNILRWYEAFSADEDGAGVYALDEMRAGRISESKARVLAGAFLAHVEHPEAYHAVSNELGALDYVVSVARSSTNAAELRDVVRTFVAGIEAEAERQRRQREPGMFDDAVLDEDEQDGPPAPEIARDGAETPNPVLDQEQDDADGYDDGGAGLRRAAEALGETPFDQADGDTEAVGLGAAAGEERDSAAEPWGPFDAAVLAALAGVPADARRVLLPALWPDGFRKGITTTRWRSPMKWEEHAMEMVRDALIEDHTPEAAAEALGLEVEWEPEAAPADVSTDTPEPEPDPTDRAVWDALTPDAQRLLVRAARGTVSGERSESGAPLALADADAADELVRAALAFRSGARLCARAWGGKLAERFGAELGEAPHPDTGGPEGTAAVEGEEKELTPPTDAELEILAEMFAAYEATQANGFPAAGRDRVARERLVERGYAQPWVGRYGRTSADRLSLCRAGTDAAMELKASGNRPAFSEALAAAEAARLDEPAPEVAEAA